MATTETSFTANIRGVKSLIESPVNKVQEGVGENIEGPTGEMVDVLDLPMSDEELLKLRDRWENIYAPYEGEIRKVFKRNLNSYLGRNRDGSLLDSDMPGPANLQFESEETFLPATLAQNPDPLVYCDNTPEGNDIANSVKAMLQFHAEELLLKRRLQVMVRQWSIYQLGVIKYGWDETINDITVDNRKIQDFVFDPTGYVDVYGHFNSWLGERIHVTAEKLAELFPKHKDYISETVQGKMGTDVTYTEWWTDEYCFSTYRRIVLDKHKNEFYNYEGDEHGEAMPDKNHFPRPMKPYTFLSVFSLQERPHDVTGLIEQNIPNQAKITKRTEQIDANISQSNNGILFSENNFNQETAKQASRALTDPNKGQVLVPQGGPIQEAVWRLPAPSFPSSAFDDLEMTENHLRSSWGTQGIASQKQTSDTTARGMILNEGRDTSRIGGGIGDVLEQSVARSIFNWLVQLYYVFYDEEHTAAVMGVGKAVEFIRLSNQNLKKQVIVGVSPNSMRLKDEITTMNMAQNLYQMGAIGPKILLETLDFPNPDESSADGVLWQADKKSYIQLNYPELWDQLQQIALQDAQAQLAAQQQMGAPQGVPQAPPQMPPPQGAPQQ